MTSEYIQGEPSLKELLAQAEAADKEFIKSPLGKEFAERLGGEEVALETMRTLTLQEHTQKQPSSTS